MVKRYYPGRMTTLLYLAYGSNLHPLRLRSRIPLARTLGLVALTSWCLRFHKRGRDGSAKCNLVETTEAAEGAYGAVYEILLADKHRLDALEGVGQGYSEQRLTLPGLGEVFFYRAQPDAIDTRLLPYDWYRDLVIAGAIHYAAPAHYLDLLQQVAYRVDLDLSRAGPARAARSDARVQRGNSSRDEFQSLPIMIILAHSLTITRGP